MNNTKTLILALLVAIFLFTGCAPKGDVERIGIISAMDNEINVLLKEADIEKVDLIGGMEYHVGKLRGKNVIITRAGIGKVRASSGVTAMLIKYNISKVLFTGIAGGVADEPQVLDEIVATRLVEHDYGIISNDGFLWVSGDPGISREAGEYYYCDEELVELAYKAAVETVGKEHVFKGTIATGDQFIASEEYVRRLKEEYNAYACEMEGASVGAICIKYGKPFVVIRALSDKADGKAHSSYKNFGDIAGANSSHIVLKMLDYIE
ncbi:MAG: 5'-methylthioadenosine/adenosylhomocysteine nucleosidase [Spirochaetia bacterium]|nr:5'-methylthioadenosine/adenosylhomocysteine nucleosidase [Spirochaetia bacterium]